MDFLSELWSLRPTWQGKALTTFLVIVAVWLARLLLLRFVSRRLEDTRDFYHWRTSTGYIGFLVAAIMLAPVWIREVRSLATFLGFVAAALVIVSKEALLNLIGWMSITWWRYFRVGDRIQCGNVSGDVIDQTISHFTLMEIGNWVSADQSTGRVVYVPNARVFAEPVFNYRQGFPFIWNEIFIRLGHDADWRKAKQVLLEIAKKDAEAISISAQEKLREAQWKFAIHYSKLTPAVYTDVDEHGIVLTVRYLCEPQRRRDSEAELWEDILAEFARQGLKPAART